MVDAERIRPMMTEFAVEIFIIADPAHQGGHVRYRSLDPGADGIDTIVVAILKPTHGGRLPVIADRHVGKWFEAIQLLVDGQRGKKRFGLRL